MTVPVNGASVDSADTIGLATTYFITDHIATTAIGGIPPKFRLTGTGSLSALGRVGSAYEWSPTILLKYYFHNAASNLRPYLAAGASYVWFSRVKLEPAAASGAFLYSPTLGTALEGPTTVKLSPLVCTGDQRRLNLQHYQTLVG